MFFTLSNGTFPLGTSPPPTCATAGYLRTLSVPGWGINKFGVARGSCICQPRGYPGAIDTHMVSDLKSMEDFIGKD